MSLRYYTLDKFDRIVCALNSRGWDRINSSTDANFIFTNLIKINFDELNEETCINHLKGSQHLSNKAFLSYHIKAAGCGHWMPLQWSAAYEDLISLLGMILLNSVYSLLKTIIQDEDLLVELKEKVLQYKQMIQVLGGMKSMYLDIVETERILHLLENPTILLVKELVSNLEESNSWRRWGGYKDIWIIKPVGLSCGENIMVVKGIKDVCQVLRDMNYKCVVQKYIEKPLLVRSSRKFDIRQWILVTSVNPLVIHGFSECYLRLSSQEYTVEESKLSDVKVHLCNHAIQKDRPTPAASPDTSSSSLEYDTMMTQGQFNTELNNILASNPQLLPSDLRGDPITDPFSVLLKPKIKQISIDTISSVRDKLCKVGNAFEWLGLDLIVTDSLDILLLEVNVSPDISLSTPITTRLVDPAINDLLRIIIDKSEVACDSTLRWEPWYKGPSESYQTIRDFAKRKTEKEMLQKDYLPRNLTVAQEIFHFIDGKKTTANEEEEEDEF